MTELFLRTTANKAGYVAVRVRNATGEVVLTGVSGAGESGAGCVGAGACASGECAECGEE